MTPEVKLALVQQLAHRLPRHFQAETLMRMRAAHELAEARAYEDEIEVETVAA